MREAEEPEDDVSTTGRGGSIDGKTMNPEVGHLCDLTGNGLPKAQIPVSPGTMTLTNDTVWTLEDLVLVESGEVLTIEPCTRIEGSGVAGILVVGRGGKIDAGGTADEPILFTSWAESADDPQAGDWGGVVLLGRAPNNRGDSVRHAGLPDGSAWEYGGSSPNDDSGRLSHVRIEYAGVAVVGTQEINGLTLASVGDGTQIDHVMVSHALDDCFEWFGGRVDASHLVANHCGDDMFDVDEGYQGTLTTLFGRQGSVVSDDANGWEADSKDDAAPISTVTAREVTLCGMGTDNAPDSNTHGAVFREGLQGGFEDQVIAGFHTGFSLRDELTDVDIDESLVWGNFENNLGETHPSTTTTPATWFSAGTDNATPDPGPFTVADCQAVGGPNAAVTGSGVGAFKSSSTWLEAPWVHFEGQ